MENRSPDESRLGAGEMASWVRAFSAQTGRKKFESPAHTPPQKKMEEKKRSGKAIHTYNLALWVAETGG